MSDAASTFEAPPGHVAITVLSEAGHGYTTLVKAHDYRRLVADVTAHRPPGLWPGATAAIH